MLIEPLSQCLLSGLRNCDTRHFAISNYGKVAYKLTKSNLPSKLIANSERLLITRVANSGVYL
jgi:predicted oxidoreductase